MSGAPSPETSPGNPRGPDFLRAASDAEFRAGLRAWLERELPAQAAGRGPAARNAVEFRLAWETHCCRAGLSGLNWPGDEGGACTLAFAPGGLS